MLVLNNNYFTNINLKLIIILLINRFKIYKYHFQKIIIFKPINLSPTVCSNKRAHCYLTLKKISSN